MYGYFCKKPLPARMRLFEVPPFVLPEKPKILRYSQCLKKEVEIFIPPRACLLYRVLREFQTDEALNLAKYLLADKNVWVKSAALAEIGNSKK